MNETGSSQRVQTTAPTGESHGSSARLNAQRAASEVDSPTVISQRPQSAPAPQGRAAPLHDLGKLLAGERLGHFELLEYVGGGGMGAVFRGRDSMLDREVAIKVLSREQAADDETRRRFQNEAQSAARLDHENIARVFYVGEDRGLHFIVFEFIDGVTIRDLVDSRGPMALEEAIGYTLQLAEALAHASSRDVVHRDIKPSNILVTRDGRVKLVDMGLARLHQRDRDVEELTASGVTLGTFDYISPEQARDPRLADVRSDLYSLGCTLFFMLTGRPPFAEGNMLQKLLQHNNEEPPDPREFNADLPAEISDVVRKMLAKDPRRRYQSPSELIADLLIQADRIGLHSAELQTTLLVAQPAGRLSMLERHLPWMAPVAMLVGAVLLLDYIGKHSSRSGALVDQWLPAGIPIADRRRTDASAIDRSLVNDRGDPRIAPSQASGGPESPLVAPPPAAVATHMQNASSAAPSPAADTAFDPSRGAISAPNAALSADALPRDARAATVEEARPEPLAPGHLVVSSTLSGPQYYTTLRAAASAARSGDLIELRYDGVRDERPMALSNVELTLRAGAGFQPTIHFRPDEPDALLYSRSMVSASGCRLAFEGVAIEFDVPSPHEIGADEWALFDVEQSQLSFVSSWLTIRNAVEGGIAYHPLVHFFRVRAALGGDSMMMADDEPSEAVSIELRDSIARGEAVFVESRDAQPFDLWWDNGLLATTEPMLVLSGGQTPPARTPGEVAVDLERLTLQIGACLVRQTNRSDAPYLLDLDMAISRSIVVAMAEAPLIEQSGMLDISSFQSKLNWHGERNSYQGFSWHDFWSIADTSFVSQPEQLSFDDWLAYWSTDFESRPSWNQVLWRNPTLGAREVHRRTPDDYAADLASGADVSIGMSSVGLDASRLPAAPFEPILDAATISNGFPPPRDF